MKKREQDKLASIFLFVDSLTISKFKKKAEITNLLFLPIDADR